MSDGSRGGRGGTYWASRVALLLVSLVVALGAAELYVRSNYRFAPWMQLGTGGTHLEQEVVQTIFEADPETIWRIRPGVTVQGSHFAFRGLLSNLQRLRSTEPIAAEKARNEFRILFLGDSSTFGWGVLPEETFASLTQEALRERFPAVRTTSINAGVPGFSLFQGWRLLETEGLGYDPDLVVVYFGSNDQGSWGNIGDYQHYELWRSTQPPEVLEWSSLARLVANALSSPEPIPEGADRPRLRTYEFRDLLARVRDASREHGAAMLVIVGPALANIDGTLRPGFLGPYQLEAATFGRSLRLGPLPEPALVNGVEVFQAKLAEMSASELFVDHIHPSAAGHAALAAALIDHIAPWLETEVEFGRVSPASS